MIMIPILWVQLDENFKGIQWIPSKCYWIPMIRKEINLLLFFLYWNNSFFLCVFKKLLSNNDWNFEKKSAFVNTCTTCSEWHLDFFNFKPYSLYTRFQSDNINSIYFVAEYLTVANKYNYNVVSQNPHANNCFITIIWCHIKKKNKK